MFIITLNLIEMEMPCEVLPVYVICAGILAIPHTPARSEFRWLWDSGVFLSIQKICF
jgi:hypothetical protein